MRRICLLCLLKLRAMLTTVNASIQDARMKERHQYGFQRSLNLHCMTGFETPGDRCRVDVEEKKWKNNFWSVARQESVLT